MKKYPLFAILLIAGCGSSGSGSLNLVNPPAVQAATDTIITKPTQISANETGNYIVQGGSLYGLPAPTGQGIVIHGNINITGQALLQDLMVQGCVTVSRTARVELTRISVTGCSGDGITIISDTIIGTAGNQSCCAKLDHVNSWGNTGSGLKIFSTADVFVTMSEFENNGDCGARLIDSPTVRITNTDFGGNVCGLFLDPTSNLAMLSNNQWGNNSGDDLTTQSEGSIVNSAEFIGPLSGCAIRSTGKQIMGANNYGPRTLC
jgi:hypothetical protein